MKKIGFYKPYWPIKFLDDRDDMDAISYEVINVMKIFAERGHICKILSKTDLINGTKIVRNNKGGLITVGTLEEKYDRIFLYGGPFKLESNKNIVNDLRKITTELDFILTDTRTIILNTTDLELFDTFYSQSTSDTYLGRPNIYGGVAEFRCYGMKLETPTEEMIQNKGVTLYFGGTTRNRIQKYKEYIWNHKDKWVITGQSNELNFNNRVTRDLYLELLSQTKFSLTFADVDYEETNFVTPRHYENIERNIISFCDTDWDDDEHIVAKDDWLRVRDSKELLYKVGVLLQNPKVHLEKLIEQQKCIKPEYINGDYVYNILKK